MPFYYPQFVPVQSNDLSPVRFFNSVYQNTNARPIMVITGVSVLSLTTSPATGSIQGFVGLTNTPNTVASPPVGGDNIKPFSTTYSELLFLVAPNLFYTVKTSSTNSSVTPTNWFEITL